MHIAFAALPVFFLELLWLMRHFACRAMSTPADWLLLVILLLCTYALLSQILFLLMKTGYRLLDSLRLILHRSETRPAIRRYRVVTIIVVLVVATASSTLASRFFYDTFADTVMIAWALFIIIGTIVWISLSLILLMIRYTQHPKPQSPGGVPQGRDPARHDRGMTGWQAGKILFNPFAMPGYVILAAILMNYRWIHLVIDLAALGMLAGWIGCAITLQNNHWFNRLAFRIRMTMPVTLLLLVLLPAVIRLSPGITPVIAQHGRLSRYAVQAFNRLLSGISVLKGGQDEFLPDHVESKSGMREIDRSFRVNDSEPVMPDAFDLNAWALKNRQDYKWHTRQMKDVLAPYRSWNIILLTVDALRADHLSCYGYPYPTTPHIDRLADDGVVFERHYTQGGDSIFSLNSLMSGKLPWSYRNDIDPMLSTILSDHGLVSAYVGYDYVLKGGAFRSGFSIMELLPGDRGDIWGRSTSRQIVDRIIDVVDRLRQRQFFVYSHLLDPHADYVINSETARFEDTTHPGYDGEIAFTDMHLGRLFEYLRQADLLDHTLIVISSDHGEAFGEHGHEYHGRFLYDESIRTPLIMTLPDVPGRRVRIPVGPVQIAPTILDFLGIAPPQPMDGINLLPLVYQGDVTGITPVEVYIPNENYKKRGIIYGPWKRIENMRDGMIELYNLEMDPAETVNMAGALE